jgi:hypothetical protein
MAALRAEQRERSVTRRKQFGLAFLAVPIIIFTLFAIGEGIGGEDGWWGHLIQLAIAIALLGGAWYVPRLGGPALILSAFALGLWVLATADDVASGLSTLTIIGLPLVISGVFFTLAGRSSPRT